MNIGEVHKLCSAPMLTPEQYAMSSNLLQIINGVYPQLRHIAWAVVAELLEEV